MKNEKKVLDNKKRYYRYYLCVAIMILLIILPGSAETYYVAPDGENSASGTISQPFATIQKAHDVVDPGDTVYIRGGTYEIYTPDHSGAGIAITKGGTSDSKRIYFWAYPGEIPVFDFSNMTISTSTYTHGFLVTGSWLHFKGLEICNVPMNINSNCGMYVENSGNNIFELMNYHHNNGSGVFVNGSDGSGGHLFLNCDSHDNYDPTGRQGDGQNADGFGVHYQTSGEVTVFRGCRAWWNSDDGWDLISQEVPVIIEDCYTMGSGYADYGTKRPADGNGNGFKAGSSKTGIRHTIRNCTAWKNRASGFYANHSTGGNDWYNNTSYSNGTQYNMLASYWDENGNRTDGVTLTGSKVHVMRNNIGFPNDNTNMNGVDSDFNTWDLNITPENSDFLSVEDPSMTVTGQDLSSSAGVLGPRQPDGSVPYTDFLKLSENSQMIDKGVDVGLEYINEPDLGAFEFGTGGSDLVYYEIDAKADPGGIIEQVPGGDSLWEGSSVTFTAVPLNGWIFEGWEGDYNGADSLYEVSSLNSDLSLNAKFTFTSDDSSLYEGENAKMVNSVIESEHSGFSGSGYANFNNLVGSSLEFSVCVSEGGEQNIEIRYANGAEDQRPVSVSVNGEEVLNSLDFTPTGDWTVWDINSISVNLNSGVNTITFTALTSEGGPNIDKIELVDPVSVATESHNMNQQVFFNDADHTIRLSSQSEMVDINMYTISGKSVLRKKIMPVSGQRNFKLPVQKLGDGLYIVKIETESVSRVHMVDLVR